ncbi:hypothetical protein M404DRAFT_994266 [Pisolithus tinctorius Marx 270]|uniref:Uncharacterized protein n=1 Tax=Pisolithus tinctorius Marx 270 TaxID=870435 RepID=A0A0C3PR57_PISTI|nr:hypothetical protein M404DRAFT_994266 [Pisolithus tinctorius Marx 270]
MTKSRRLDASPVRPRFQCQTSETPAQRHAAIGLNTTVGWTAVSTEVSSRLYLCRTPRFPRMERLMHGALGRESKTL